MLLEYSYWSRIMPKEYTRLRLLETVWQIPWVLQINLNLNQINGYETNTGRNYWKERPQ